MKCNRPKTSIPFNAKLGIIRSISNEDNNEFIDVANNTSKLLADSWLHWFEMKEKFSEPNLENTHSHFGNSPLKSWQISAQNLEMKEARLSSDISKPFETFSEDNEKVDLMLPPICTPFLDPKSEEFHSKLVESLGLNEEYDYVNPEIMEKFKDLLKQYPNVCAVPGSPLGEIKGFEHSIETDDAAPIYKSPYRKSPKELKAIRDEIERMLTLKIIQPSKSDGGSPVILVRKPLRKEDNRPRDLQSITVL